ncbi:DUF4296 domain-containing protein [Pontibacter sp. G13]|uniref:DUF4296 domain-containing protein n=1 Tax=Pontibacter sp. G13 TaxID=3074898 RepID=UPI00288A7C69|nr:DUF4296 domain-containing protein [Pontibacter sp. G13]WNJ19435.1 DUF4296 domain-containing protein [Pontibacter sp. G13]
MKRTWTFIIIACMALAGCEEVVENHLSEKEMQDLLLQVHLTDAWVEVSKQPINVRKRMRAELYDDVLASRGLDRETFEQSYQYYLKHPTVMDSLYQFVIDSLNRRMELHQDTLMHRNRKSPPKPDSVRSVVRKQAE